MNAKENDETNEQAIVTEDLSTVNAEASKIKGGIKLKECLISNYQISGHGGGEGL
ncbi:MAG: hypothetical protein AB1757_12700 [Acidobacteriota bacterium]